MNTLNEVVVWIAVAVATVPVWATLLWDIWDGVIRPRRIVRGRIDALAAAMLARHGERAAEMAAIAEDRAWRYSNGFEQGLWRRVRTRLQTLQP